MQETNIGTLYSLEHFGASCIHLKLMDFVSCVDVHGNDMNHLIHLSKRLNPPELLHVIIFDDIFCKYSLVAHLYMIVNLAKLGGY